MTLVNETKAKMGNKPVIVSVHVSKPMIFSEIESNRAALDAENKLIAFHIRAGGIPESPLAANRFPAGALDNYLAEDWSIDSNITIGAFRAPRSNFIASAEQSFLDEVAEAAGKDPIAFRLELLDRAQKDPVGENYDYEADRYAGVLKLVKEKSGWGKSKPMSTGVSLPISAITVTWHR